MFQVPLSLLFLPLISFFYILPEPFSSPFINFIKFKTAEELQRQPQTDKEHRELIDPDGLTTRFNETSSGSSTSNSSSDDNLYRLQAKPFIDKNSLSPKTIANNGAINHTVNHVKFNGIPPVNEAQDQTTSFDLDSDGFVITNDTRETTPQWYLPSNQSLLKNTTNELNIYRKAYEYFNAPITKFWSNLFFYLAFLWCFRK